MADKVPTASFSQVSPVGASCPACTHQHLTAIYELDTIPVQSNLLFTTAAEAMRCPTGALRLVVCERCGFIFNLAFDAASQQLSARYEATQGFSPTFNAFAKSLAKRWIERYELSGKDVIEIGCGRGEFISLLCELGGSRGIGIDPAVSTDQLAHSDSRVRWIKDHYSERYAHLPADFICCRHTLEHIPNVLEFLKMIRRIIGDRRIVVGFEVPDTLRVLREGAFWDAYYEHCSYFSESSLARAFQRAGFSALSLTREYDDQYLVIEAAPAAIAEEVEQVDEALVSAAKAFTVESAQRLKNWRKEIGNRLAAGQTIAIWGAGSKAVGFLSTLGIRNDQIAEVVDINPHKQNTFLPATAQRIIPPAALKNSQPDCVIVMNPVYRREIELSLASMGIPAAVLTL